MRILITGGTGTFGRAMTRRIIEREPLTTHVVVLSRDEMKQAAMLQEIGHTDRARVHFFIGDVRDLPRLRRAFEGVDLVIHAAALKRIEVGHYNPTEMVKTNVMGTMNVIEAAQDCSVPRVIGLSTDKAFQPVSAYGTSKAMMEAMLLAANNTRGTSGPIYAATRYGNIWNANGSILPKWQALIRAGATSVPVTDPNCTRFFMRVQQATSLVSETAKTMKGGELVIPDLPAYRIGDLAEALGVGMNVIGLPEWEKKHESMGVNHCSADVTVMTVEQLREEVRDADLHG